MRALSSIVVAAAALAVALATEAPASGTRVVETRDADGNIVRTTVTETTTEQEEVVQQQEVTEQEQETREEHVTRQNSVVHLPDGRNSAVSNSGPSSEPDVNSQEETTRKEQHKSFKHKEHHSDSKHVKKISTQEYQSRSGEKRYGDREWSKLRNCTGKSDHADIQNLFGELTGHSNIEDAIGSLSQATSMEDIDDILYCIKWFKGKYGFDFVMKLMRLLDHNTRLTGPIRMLKALSGEKTTRGALQFAKTITGVGNIDAFVIILKTLSGKTDLEEMAEYYRGWGRSAHAHGVAGAADARGTAGFVAFVHLITGGRGPVHFEKTFRIIANEPDLDGCTKELFEATGTNDLGEAINEFKNIMGLESLGDCAESLMIFTGQSHVKTSFLEIKRVFKRRRLVVIIKTLYKYTGRKTIKEVVEVFYEYFKERDVVRSLENLSKVTTRTDLLQVFIDIIESVGAETIEEAIQYFWTIAGPQDTVSPVELFILILKESGCRDIFEFITEWITITETKDFRVAIRLVFKLTRSRNIFEVCRLVRRVCYKHTSVIVSIKILIKLFRCRNFTELTTTLTRLTGKRDFYDSTLSLLSIANVDLVDLITVVVTLSSHRDFNEAKTIFINSVGTKDFYSAIVHVTHHERQTDILEYIRTIKKRGGPQPRAPPHTYSPDLPDSPVSPDSPATPVSPDSPDSPETPYLPDSPGSPNSPESPDSPGSPDSPYSERAGDYSCNDTGITFKTLVVNTGVESDQCYCNCRADTSPEILWLRPHTT